MSVRKANHALHATGSGQRAARSSAKRKAAPEDVEAPLVADGEALVAAESGEDALDDPLLHLSAHGLLAGCSVCLACPSTGQCLDQRPGELAVAPVHHSEQDGERDAVAVDEEVASGAEPVLGAWIASSLFLLRTMRRRRRSGSSRSRWSCSVGRAEPGATASTGRRLAKAILLGGRHIDRQQAWSCLRQTGHAAG